MATIIEKAQLKAQVRRVKSLPTLPGVVNKVVMMVETDDIPISEIGEMISSDQVLASKILKIVNSPFYGFPGRIATINHALVLLGFNVVKGIMLSAGTIDFQSAILSGLWPHSLGVATAAHRIALTIGMEDPEEVSTAGLLHDLGKVVLGTEMRDLCKDVMDVCRQEQISFYEAERKCLDNQTHCDIAGWLAEMWNLPPRLRDPIVFHHHPTLARSAPQATAVIHLADILIRSLQFGSGGDPFIPTLRPEAMETLGLKMGDLVPLLEVINDDLEDLDTSDFT